MTTGGEGGMITLNDEKLYEQMWSFKDHGKSFAKVNTPNPSTGFRYIHDTVGTNWRLTEMQAALGRYQLTQLDNWVSQRQHNVGTFNKALAEVDGIRLTIPPDHINHACYKFYFFTDPGALKSDWDRDRVVAEIVERGVKCFTGACPEIYREEAFTRLYGEHPVLPVAAALGATSVMLNVHPGITDEHCEVAADVIREVFALAMR
jgi:dTDP-4-amino-4,6-dideoxygalactose transaminase